MFLKLSFAQMSVTTLLHSHDKIALMTCHQIYFSEAPVSRGWLKIFREPVHVDEPEELNDFHSFLHFKKYIEINMESPTR